jgi:O-methyltransferase
MFVMKFLNKLLNRDERHQERDKKVYVSDGTRTNNKNLEALLNPHFVNAWEKACELNKIGWPNGVPDIRWRAHIATWAAEHGSKIDGDFVECGVHTGLLSLTICHFLDFNKVDKKFYLFDTFDGIPEEDVPDEEINLVQGHNKDIYFDCFEITKKNFLEFNKAELVKGIIPQSLDTVDIKAVSYLSIDMNNSTAEINALTHFWPKLTPSAIVLLDDYAFQLHEAQKRAVDEFAKSENVPVVSLPTGQGLIIKPCN